MTMTLDVAQGSIVVALADRLVVSQGMWAESLPRQHSTMRVALGSGNRRSARRSHGGRRDG